MAAAGTFGTFKSATSASGTFTAYTETSPAGGVAVAMQEGGTGSSLEPDVGRPTENADAVVLVVKAEEFADEGRGTS